MAGKSIKVGHNVIKSDTTLNEIKLRLETLRLAFGMVDQTKFADFLGISNTSYNNYMTLRRRISLDHALLICKRTGASLDWIYTGSVQGMPPSLMIKTSNDEA